jgi:hypothetical protein
MLDPELGVGAQLARLQRILDATCDRLDVPKTRETLHIREFLARQLISFEADADLDDETLSKRLAARARLIGLGSESKLLAKLIRK